VAIEACQSGKHVYLEGSCAHTVVEAAQVARAARRHDRIVWTGGGSRSSAAVREAVRLVRDHHLGRVPLARALSYTWGDASSGDGIERAVHHIDVARQGLSLAYPSTVTAHPADRDGSALTSSLSCRYEFAAGSEAKAIELEIRQWTSAGGVGDASAALFYGPEGFLAVDGSASYQTWIGPRRIPGAGRRATAGPHTDFIDAVRGDNRADTQAALEDSAVSTLLVHLAVVSHRLARPVAFDGASRAIARDPQASEMLAQLQTPTA
jgi:predicted dehydrogenase